MMAPPMGEHGQGGITKRSDGRLQVSLVMPNGHRAYRMVGRDRDAKRQMRRAKSELQSLIEAREGDLDPSRLTLAAFLHDWLTALRKRGKHRPRTLEFYAMIAEKAIIPALGAYPLSRLTERHVQAWLDADTSRSVHHRRNVLRIALGAAKRQRLVARNVAEDVEMRDRPEFEGDPLTVDEVRRLLETTKDDRLGPFWRLAILTGARSAELAGLARDDLDADGLLHLRGQLVQTPGGWTLGDTKAARKREAIALDAGTVTILRWHKRRQSRERRADWPYWGLMFVTPDGMPYPRWTLLREFHDALDRAGIRRRRVHDLRVTNATTLQTLGIPEDVRMARLGHNTKAMARHYAIVGDEVDRAASERLAEAIG